jgi:hypothetical protein
MTELNVIRKGPIEKVRARYADQKPLFLVRFFPCLQSSGGSLRRVLLLAQQSGGHAMRRNHARSDLPSLVVVIVSGRSTSYASHHKSFPIRLRTPLVPLALPRRLSSQAL